MSWSLEARFERYCDRLIETLRPADREQPARWYLQGLLLPGSARALNRWRRESTRSACVRPTTRCITWWPRQTGVMRRCCRRCRGPSCRNWLRRMSWCTGSSMTRGFPKKGNQSVGVARQYCGQTGKQDNCRVAVSLSIASDRGSLSGGISVVPAAEVDRRPGAVPQGGRPRGAGVQDQAECGAAAH